MPRLPPSLIWRAHNISPHAATLLPVCRDIPSALTELRWIREHVETTSSSTSPSPSLQLRRLCRQRGRGVPLQYVLGTQPFGDLEIKCRRGVLIPRPEPEAYTTHLARLLKSGSLAHLLPPSHQPLRILDFCTGTGCIALLLYAHLTSPHLPQALRVTGVDVSPQAISLSRANLAHNLALGLVPPTTPDRSVAFTLSSIFSPRWTAPSPSSSPELPCDILVSNPPYISPRGFDTDVARSVRNHEPRLAQVPEPRPPDDDDGGRPVVVRPEDVFYARLLEIAAAARPGVMLFETGGMDQALRVVRMVGPMLGADGLYGVEIWRDWPDGRPEVGEETAVTVAGVEGPVRVRGTGHGRSVFVYRK